jgi:beta-phosphoglucomutase-like phosphatase (HAD superfamily)
MKLLIFDIDGTLTDTKRVDDECFINAFQDEYGVILTNTDWTTFVNVTDTGLFNLQCSRKNERNSDDNRRTL